MYVPAAPDQSRHQEIKVTIWVARWVCFCDSGKTARPKKWDAFLRMREVFRLCSAVIAPQASVPASPPWWWGRLHASHRLSWPSHSSLPASLDGVGSEGVSPPVEAPCILPLLYGTWLMVIARAQAQERRSTSLPNFFVPWWPNTQEIGSY